MWFITLIHIPPREVCDMTLPNIAASFSGFRDILWVTWAFIMAEVNVPSVKRLPLEVRVAVCSAFWAPKTMPTNTCLSVAYAGSLA